VNNALFAASSTGLEPDDPGRQLEQQRQELPVGVSEQQHAGQSEQQHRVPPGRSSTGSAGVRLTNRMTSCPCR